MTTDCVMFGVASPMVADVHGILHRLDWTVHGFVNGVDGAEPEGIPSWTGLDGIDPAWLDLDVVIPIFTPGHRRDAVEQARTVGFTTMATVIDPTAVVAPRTETGEGVLVNAGAIVAAGVAVGDFVHLNRGANVGHDVVLEDYASLAPGCVLTGGVHVERGAFVGAGAVITPGVRVGANAVVGAGAVVVRDVDERTIVVGNPAAVQRSDIVGYKGVAA
ncbi:MAG: DapH/DapD/GlmU-related protein [Acidimicrobiales bacterium]|nr:DapH/DapD/GlmU-related protein [Acidimicrobiales bacterium]